MSFAILQSFAPPPFAIAQMVNGSAAVMTTAPAKPPPIQIAAIGPSGGGSSTIDIMALPSAP